MSSTLDDNISSIRNKPPTLNSAEVRYRKKPTQRAVFRFPHSQQSSVSSSTSTNPQTSHTLCVMENTAEGPNHLRNTSVCCGERIISEGDKMDKQKVKNNIEKQTVNKAMQRQRWTDRKTARQSQTVCHSLTTADLETADKTPTTCHSFQIQGS